ncbi:MAG TPA: diguanylate cyclase [Candidatus Methylomirabilis sp.]|nr:diguanylate cyclase [Candidatus Methylomirabilis sp.]
MTADRTDSRSTILVVEDEVGIARMIQVLLEARGFVALVSHSGNEAFDRLASRSVDLVLLDLMMPGMDGYEVCRRLKADPRWSHIPVVMLTAKDTVRDKILGLEIGADDYITKPFNTDELVARINVLLRIQAMSQELVRRNRELQALNAVALAVSRSLSLEEILEGALQRTLENLRLETGLVHLVEPKTGHLVLAAWRGLPMGSSAAFSRLLPGTGWAWQAMAQPAALVVTDAAREESLGALAFKPHQPLVGIPLRLRDRELGVLSVIGHPDQPLSAEDIGLLEAIGRQVAIALENAHLYADSRRKAREFEGLNQIGRAMAATFNLQEILTRISEAVSNLFHARAMSLMLLSSDGQTLSTVAGSNLFDEKSHAEQSQGARRGSSPSFVAVLEKRPVAAPDLLTDEVYAPWLQAARDNGYRSFLAIPLIVQERALGCMNLYLTEPHEFDNDEIQILSTFASQAAISIENARLFEEARQLAITDELTGLANHRQFYQQLTREVQRAERYGRPLTLLMIDVDFFKEYNDRYGHLAGDHALRDLAYVMRCNARNVDILARYGGEEFAIILPETDLNRAAFQAERIRAAVAAHPFRSNDPAFRGVLTVSIGVTTLAPGIQKIEELVHDADQAMYLAKTRGRNRVELAPIRGRSADGT